MNPSNFSKLISTMAVAFLACLALPAFAQVTPTTPIVLTNLPLQLIGGTSSNVTTQVIALRQGGGFSVAVSAQGTNAVTTNTITLTWNVSRDGTSTNFSNTGPIVTTVPMNGTNAVYYWTNYPVSLVNNNPWLTLSSWSSANTSTNAVTNLTVTVLFGNPSYNTGY